MLPSASLETAPSLSRQSPPGRGRPLRPVRSGSLMWRLADLVPFGYDSPAMPTFPVPLDLFTLADRVAQYNPWLHVVLALREIRTAPSRSEERVGAFVTLPDPLLTGWRGSSTESALGAPSRSLPVRVGVECSMPSST